MNKPAPPTNSVLRQVADLHNLSQEELKDLWRTLYGTEPPAHNRPHLVSRLAYRIQELTYGGISEAAKAKMKAIMEASGLDENGGEQRAKRRRGTDRKDQPVVGTRIVRDWNGQTHEVIVVHGGFQYGGRLFRSLTAVAEAITGSHWNGRAFFGLAKSGTRKRKMGEVAIES